MMSPNFEFHLETAFSIIELLLLRAIPFEYTWGGGVERSPIKKSWGEGVNMKKKSLGEGSVKY